MTTHDNVLPAETAQPSPSLFLRSSFGPLAQRIADWVTTAADYNEAAAMYERLSRLSDAELKRRGLSRTTLARDICKSCDRTADR
jgi:hypothetical protein